MPGAVDDGDGAHDGGEGVAFDLDGVVVEEAAEEVIDEDAGDAGCEVGCVMPWRTFMTSTMSRATCSVSVCWTSWAKTLSERGQLASVR